MGDDWSHFRVVHSGRSYGRRSNHASGSAMDLNAADHRGKFEVVVAKAIERAEPHTFEEIAAEIDIRVDALKRGRTDWGCDGSHRGKYTARQIARGAPNCPRELHHHHDAFCAEPSAMELRLAGVEEPVGGWGSRA